MTDNSCSCNQCAKDALPENATPLDSMLALNRMFVCEVCTFKRCPHATDHRLECTGSNEPGQKGSSWENYAVQ